MDKKQKVLVFFLILLLLLVFVSIFRFSSENGEKSKGTSKTVTEEITKPIKTIQELEPKEKEIALDNINKVLRKIAHFSLYMLIGAVSMCIMILGIKDKVNYRKYVSLAIGVLYAITDEIHQLFVDGRSAMITDVFIDTAGVVVGIWVVNMIYNTVIKKKNATSLHG